MCVYIYIYIIKARVLGFDRVTGLISIFKKLKRYHFSKKKKNSTGCNRVLPGQPAGSHRVMNFPIFSSTWPNSSFGLVGSWIDPPGWVSKLYIYQNKHPTNFLVFLITKHPQGLEVVK